MIPRVSFNGYKVEAEPVTCTRHRPRPRERVKDHETGPSRALEKVTQKRHRLLCRVYSRRGCEWVHEHLVSFNVVIPGAAEVVVFAAEVVVFAAEVVVFAAEGGAFRRLPYCLIMFEGWERVLRVGKIMARHRRRARYLADPFVKFLLSFKAKLLFYFFSFFSHIFFYGGETRRVGMNSLETRCGHSGGVFLLIKKNTFRAWGIRPKPAIFGESGLRARLPPDQVIQKRKIAVEFYLAIRSDFFVAKPIKRAVRFKNPPELRGHGGYPCAELVEVFPLSVPFIRNNFEIRRVGENEVDALVGESF